MLCSGPGLASSPCVWSHCWWEGLVHARLCEPVQAYITVVAHALLGYMYTESMVLWAQSNPPVICRKLHSQRNGERLGYSRCISSILWVPEGALVVSGAIRGEGATPTQAMYWFQPLSEQRVSDCESNVNSTHNA